MWTISSAFGNSVYSGVDLSIHTNWPSFQSMLTSRILIDGRTYGPKSRAGSSPARALLTENVVMGTIRLTRSKESAKECGELVNQFIQMLLGRRLAFAIINDAEEMKFRNTSTTPNNVSEFQQIMRHHGPIHNSYNTKLKVTKLNLILSGIVA